MKPERQLLTDNMYIKNKRILEMTFSMLGYNSYLLEDALILKDKGSNKTIIPRKNSDGLYSFVTEDSYISCAADQSEDAFKIFVRDKFDRARETRISISNAWYKKEFEAVSYEPSTNEWYRFLVSGSNIDIGIYKKDPRFATEGDIIRRILYDVNQDATTVYHLKEKDESDETVIKIGLVDNKDGYHFLQHFDRSGEKCHIGVPLRSEDTANMAMELAKTDATSRTFQSMMEYFENILPGIGINLYMNWPFFNQFNSLLNSQERDENFNGSITRMTIIPTPIMIKKKDRT